MTIKAVTHRQMQKGIPGHTTLKFRLFPKGSYLEAGGNLRGILGPLKHCWTACRYIRMWHIDTSIVRSDVFKKPETARRSKWILLIVISVMQAVC